MGDRVHNLSAEHREDGLDVLDLLLGKLKGSPLRAPQRRPTGPVRFGLDLFFAPEIGTATNPAPSRDCVPMDFTCASTAVVANALSIVNETGAHLTLLHVLQAFTSSSTSRFARASSRLTTANG